MQQVAVQQNLSCLVLVLGILLSAWIQIEAWHKQCKKSLQRSKKTFSTKHAGMIIFGW